MSIEDLTALDILNKRYKVTPRQTHSNFLPYTDSMGSHSPFTDFMYYQKLPEVYRTFDSSLGRPLYRYLQSLLEGGYADIIYNNTKGTRGIDNLLDMIDPQTCPAEFLPYYCKSMGIEWFQDLIIEREGIDPYYFIRTFLCNVGEIYKRRGTESVIKYIAKVLTSMDVKLTYNRVMTGSITKERTMWVELQAHTEEEIQNVGVNSEIIQRSVNTQIPYYLTARVLYTLKKGDIIVVGYTGSALAKVKKQTLSPPLFDPPEIVDYIYRVENDEVHLIKYIGDSTKLTVPSTIEGLPVTKLYSTTFNYSNVERVKLPDSVISIE